MASLDFMKSLQFAAQKHSKQRRKDPEGTPYVNHVINVCTNLVEAGIEDEAVLMAALLHDVVEDTDTTVGDVEQLFGTDVASLVHEVTDDKSLEKAERKRLQIVNAARSTRRANLIKLADKLDNLRDLQINTPHGWTEERREEYFVWAKQVVDNLRGTNEQLERELDEIFSQRNLL
ncbi:guanosine-3',5'-bis(diphosphate) 3'-pyrophosphohydrolase MESH1 [Drosophila grimshawi]|uniref:Guanosine-3',5'-bis(diphosphate) 3'-pyrophosphohydrolase MESH1 n=1 Tax=Drosophila grimshawi TaxID=7222 RepID=B4JYI8_DROGR|nr:guanosine-3',5'-bis(diphosphate) 3'-pyrophosphohydrolase MESH1 [Drosophila grimshawi]EDV90750.1 GH14007 [Drosophila grimshawi]